MATPLLDYTVMVRIMALNGLGPVFRQLSADALGLGSRVDSIGKKFGQWNVGILAAGAALTGLGVAALKFDMGLAKAGDKIIQLQNQFRQLSEGQVGVDKMTAAAFSASQATPNVAYADSLAITRKIYGIFMNAQEAAAATPMAVLASAVMKGANIPGGADALANIMKTGEMTGAFYKGEGAQREFSPEMMSKFIEAAVKGLQVPGGGLITTAQFRNATMRAQPASYIMPPELFIPLMMEGVQQMRSTFGAGLAYIYRELTGSIITKPQLTALQQYGLVVPGGSVRIPGSRGASLQPGGLRGYDEAVTKGDLVGWVKDVLTPALIAGKAKTPNEQLAAVSRMFNMYAARDIADIMRNLPAYERTREAISREPSLQDQYIIASTGYDRTLDDLKGAFESLRQVLGVAMVGPITAGMRMLTIGIERLTQYIVNHPEAGQQIANLLIGTAKGFLFLGSALVSAALLSMVGPGGLIFLLASAIVALANAFQMLPIDTMIKLIGAFGGALIGGRIGAAGGGLIGGAFAGVGAGPGALAGGIGGALIGGYEGWNAAGKAFNAGQRAISPFLPDLSWKPIDAPLIDKPFFQDMLSAWPGAGTTIDAHGNDWPKYAPGNIQSTIMAYEAMRGAAVPPAANYGEPATIDVNVKTIAPHAHKNLVRGVSKAQSDNLNSNPNGINRFNPAQSYTAPSTATGTSVLTR